MIPEQENGPVGAVTPDRAGSETPPLRSEVPNGIEHPAGAGVNPVQAPNTTGAAIPDMPFHPLAETVPLRKSKQLNALAKDIKRSGQRDDIMLYENKILDGRCRYLACKEAGIEPRFAEFTGNDPVAYVISKNLLRRHLTPSQLAAASIKLLPLAEAEARKRMLAGRAGPPKIVPEGSPTPSSAVAEAPGEARPK